MYFNRLVLKQADISSKKKGVIEKSVFLPPQFKINNYDRNY
jgi:hypothetical protein